MIFPAQANISEKLTHTGAVLFLTGTLLGMIFSPRKYQVIGSNNGNGSGNGNEAKAETKEDAHQ